MATVIELLPGKSIQAAIDTLKSVGGGILQFFQGKYHAQQVDLSGCSGITLRGVPGAYFTGPATSVPFFLVRNCSNITFEDLEWCGGFLTDTNERYSSAIRTDNLPGEGETRNLTVRNCRFNAVHGDAIRLGPNTYNTIIEGCTMVDGLGFLELSGVKDRPVKGTFVRRNTILGTPTAANSYRLDKINGSDDIIDMWGCILGLTIEHNLVDMRCTEATSTVCNRAIRLSSTDAGRELRDIEISNNIFRNCINNGNHAPAGAISVVSDHDVHPADAYNLAVHNNVFDRCWYAFRSENITAQNAAFYNNICLNCIAPIELLGNKFMVRDNLIDGTNGNKSIRVQSWESIVQNNLIKNSAFRNGPDCPWVKLPDANAYMADIYITTGHGSQIVKNTLVGSLTAGCSGIKLVGGDKTNVADNDIQRYVLGVDVFHADATATTLSRNLFRDCTQLVSDAGKGTVMNGVKSTNGVARPVNGAWIVGDIVWNSAPVPGGNIGWVCIVAGTPGIWKPFGTIET